MLELLRPSFVEANDVQNQEIALDFIGKRGNAVGLSYEKRIRHGSDILQKEMLPHVGIKTDCGKKKAFFFGYLVRRRFLFYLFVCLTPLPLPLPHFLFLCPISLTDSPFADGRFGKTAT